MMKLDCKTRYPIILAHGLAASDRSARHPAWGRIPETLRARGAVVYCGGQDAWGSIETGAAQLARTVRRAMAEQHCKRVNIIAHSKGGLEARYLISGMGFGEKIASLSTVSTPHRGSRVAEILLYARPGVALWARRNDAYWAAHGDEKPETLRAGEQLTPRYLAQFNRENPDAPAVFYQSWGTEIRRTHGDTAMMLTRGLFYPAHGVSDGLVTPDSAKWGSYRGTLQNVSHQQAVDVLQKDFPGFSARTFYCRMVRELAEKGF